VQIVLCNELTRSVTGCVPETLRLIRMAESPSAEYARCLRLSLTAAIDIPAVTLIMCLSFRHGACLMSGHGQVVTSKGENRYVLLWKWNKYFGGGRLIHCKVSLKLAFLSMFRLK
jgi:hypothetical protein